MDHDTRKRLEGFIAAYVLLAVCIGIYYLIKHFVDKGKSPFVGVYSAPVVHKIMDGGIPVDARTIPSDIGYTQGTDPLARNHITPEQYAQMSQAERLMIQGS